MKKILIVEDDRRIKKIYSRLLKSEGYGVFGVSNASDAREVLKKENVDLVLLDIRLPEVDGSVLFSMIGLFHKRLKVIVSSVYPLDEQRRIIEGAYDYYDKSQGVDKLLLKVRRALVDM